MSRQAANASVVAFVDIDEKPGWAARNALRHVAAGTVSYTRLFFRTEACLRGFCPASEGDIQRAARNGTCDPALAGAGNWKVFADPHALSSMVVHEGTVNAHLQDQLAWQHSGACLEHETRATRSLTQALAFVCQQRHSDT